jgi:hypothetical protein
MERAAVEKLDELCENILVASTPTMEVSAAFVRALHDSNPELAGNVLHAAHIEVIYTHMHIRICIYAHKYT